MLVICLAPNSVNYLGHTNFSYHSILRESASSHEVEQALTFASKP